MPGLVQPQPAPPSGTLDWLSTFAAVSVQLVDALRQLALVPLEGRLQRVVLQTQCGQESAGGTVRQGEGGFLSTSGNEGVKTTTLCLKITSCSFLLLPAG